MIRKIKRIAPLQLGKILAVLYGMMGLIFLPFALLGALFAAHAPHANNSFGPAVAGVGVMLAFGIFMPIAYAFFGFIFGILSAALYNLIAGWIGGLEVEVE